MFFVLKRGLSYELYIHGLKYMCAVIIIVLLSSEINLPLTTSKNIVIKPGMIDIKYGLSEKIVTGVIVT